MTDELEAHRRRLQAVADYSDTFPHALTVDRSLNVQREVATLIGHQGAIAEALIAIIDTLDDGTP